MSEPADHVGGAGTTCKRRQDVSDVGLEAWKLLFRLFEAEKGLIHAAWARLPLTPRQAILLWHIEPGNPVPMNQLASALDCDASNVTVLVDKLEALKLIGRQAHEKDRRVKIIALTERGKAMRAALLAHDPQTSVLWFVGDFGQPAGDFHRNP